MLGSSAGWVAVQARRRCRLGCSAGCGAVQVGVQCKLRSRCWAVTPKGLLSAMGFWRTVREQGMLAGLRHWLPAIGPASPGRSIRNSSSVLGVRVA